MHGRIPHELQWLPALLSQGSVTCTGSFRGCCTTMLGVQKVMGATPVVACPAHFPVVFKLPFAVVVQLRLLRVGVRPV